MLRACSIVKVKPVAKVITIEPYCSIVHTFLAVIVHTMWPTLPRLEMFLDPWRIRSIRAGVAERLTRWPSSQSTCEDQYRDPKLHGSGQASQWAFGSQGFESLPRRSF
jgi:hypothetical protein